MTDKQIIIDDYFTECTDEGRGTIGYYLIDDFALIKKIREQNEYIKAKEQECERLKEELDNELQWHKSTDKIDTINHEYVSKLKAENEELKKCYKNNSALLDFKETNTTKLVNKVMKYEQALKEIKELCKPQFELFVYRLNAQQLAEQILQKISEVMDETNTDNPV